MVPTRTPSRAEQASSSGTTESTTTAQIQDTGRQAQFKVAAPDLYYGERKKLRQFIQQLRLNFLFHPGAVDTEEKKVVYAATYLRGAAFDWFEPYLKEHLGTPEERRTARTIQIFQHFSNFIAAIEQVYGDVDTVKEAVRDLQDLRQRGSATEYASKFHQLASRINWDQTAFADTFYRGLKDSVKDELARMDRPEDLMPLIELSIKIDNRMYERRLEKGRNGEATSFYRHQANTQKKKTRTPGYYPPGQQMPMDLDATKQRSKPRNAKWKAGTRDKISESQRSERLRKNLCLYCGKPGHRAKECKASKQQLNATEGTPEEPEIHRKPQRKNWADKQSMGKKGNTEERGNRGQLRKSTPETAHHLLSWTACYNDQCQTHAGDKDGAGWYPRKPRTQQSLNALFTYDDDEPEYDCDNEDSDPGPEAMKRYAEVLEVKKPDYVRILTNLWTRVECLDPDCEQSSQHEHVAYDPEAVPKEQGKAFTIEFCKKEGCPDHGKSEFHSHQGSDKRDLSEAITLNELEEGWETIEGPDQEIESDEDVESFNLEEAEPVKDRKKYGIIQDENRTWREPYGHFPCSDMLCAKHQEYERHEHFRNYTKEERENIGIDLATNIKEVRTPCNETLGCLITGMHTHISEESKNLWAL